MNDLPGRAQARRCVLIGCLVLFAFNDADGNCRVERHPTTHPPHTVRNNYAAIRRSSPAWGYRPTEDRFPYSARTLPKLLTGALVLSDRTRLFFLLFSFPSVQTGGSGGSLNPLVDFYSKLPKGPAPQTSFGGLKARYFSGKNASAAPILATILGLFAIGYTIDYQSAYQPRSLPSPQLSHTAVTLFSFLPVTSLILGPGFTLCAVHLSASYFPFGLWNHRD